MSLIIISELVGIPGEEFTPGEYTNVEALIEGGFIKDNKTSINRRLWKPRVIRDCGLFSCNRY